MALSPPRAIFRPVSSSSDAVEGSGIWFGEGEDGSMAKPDDKLGALPFGECRIQELRCEANEGYALWEDAFNVSLDTTAIGFGIDLGTVDNQPVPLLSTEAAGAADGDHALSPEGTVTVIDEVAYANLVPGKTYTVKSTLMDKTTGRPLVVNGSEVTSEKEFAPIAPFGYVKVELMFDAIALAGKQIVAFESLALDEDVVATHEDIEDEGQSVDLAEKPGPGNPKAGLAQTGDTNNVVPLICLTVVAALIAALVALHERRAKHKDSSEGEETGEEDSEEEEGPQEE